MVIDIAPGTSSVVLRPATCVRVKQTATMRPSVAPTGEYWDWMLGADYAIAGTPLTVGVAYTDTDIDSAEAAYLRPSFSKGQDGPGNIAGPQVVFSLTAAF